MSDQSQSGIRFAPGEASIKRVNWPGLVALYVKEVRRFFKVQLQTIWAPAVTNLLFLVIFTVALGGAGKTVLGHPFADFVAPGLIVMGMMQNAFANASFRQLWEAERLNPRPGSTTTHPGSTPASRTSRTGAAVSVRTSATTSL